MNPHKRNSNYFTLYLALVFLFIGCQSPDDKKNNFTFRPVLKHDYTYSLSRTSIKQWSYNMIDNTVFDTMLMDFTVRNIKSTDSLTTCKLTFNDLVLKLSPTKVTFNTADTTYFKALRHYYIVSNTIGNYLHGLSVQVDITNKGMVKKVNGLDELIANISRTSYEDKASIKAMLADYISADAIKDLVNSCFSVPPDTIVTKADKWANNITLTTKAPIKVTNFFLLEKRTGDSSYVTGTSILASEHAEGDPVPKKGKQNGRSIISYSSGMPFEYETDCETVTTTTNYNITEKDQFKIKRN